jgi:hypothetical protein
MGQSALLQSQPLISDLLGQIGYENYGLSLVFSKDIKTLFPDISLGMRLAILDLSQYDDYSILPLMPEMEWTIKQEVVKLYSGVGVPDKLVDSSNKGQQGVPLPQQKQT